jgi:hypothetical protein
MAVTKPTRMFVTVPRVPGGTSAVAVGVVALDP